MSSSAKSSLSPMRAAWQRLMRQRTNAIALVFLVVLVLLCAIGPALSPYDQTQQDLNLKATDPNGKITQLQYDGNGNITRVTDAANAITQYAYDPRNRLTSITDPFNVVEQWTWDNKGNLATYKERRNKTTTFSYDALDRLSGTIYADAPWPCEQLSGPGSFFWRRQMAPGRTRLPRR